ncbi:DUF642 domain-containing protein [Streptomyces sp. NPDC006184]|uniref:DUF642 domain-containing protein n=1 Tax=Streptomyces sp. NPDC006184 TaxID=3155455 RepID=UPI0033A0F215
MAIDFRNASFGEPSLTTEPFVQFTTDGGRHIPGWKVTQGVVEVVRLGSGDGPDTATTQALRLKNEKRAEDRDVGGVSQDIPTRPGERVTIRWKERADRGGDSTPNEQRYTVQVTPVRGTPSTLKKPFDPEPVREQGWVTRSVEFTADASTTTVRFTAYKAGLRCPLITGLTATSSDGEVSGKPRLFATADATVVAAQAGDTVAVAFFAGNRGSAPAVGDKVLVTLTPNPPLALAQDAPATVSFPGQQLVAGGPTLPGEFKVVVPPGTAAGTYTAQAVVSYDGLVLSDTLVWQIEVTAKDTPKPVVDESQLVVFQVTSEPTEPPSPYLMFMAEAPKWPSAHPGRSREEDSLLCIGIATLGPNADLLGLPQEFKAPTGFVFTDVAAFGHFRTVRNWAAVSPKPRLVLRRSEDNTKAWVTGSETGQIPVHRLEPASFTDPAKALTHNQVFLGYGFSLAARPDAKPGLYEDGYAKFGKNLTVRLIGRIL